MRSRFEPWPLHQFLIASLGSKKIDRTAEKRIASLDRIDRINRMNRKRLLLFRTRSRRACSASMKIETKRFLAEAIRKTGSGCRALGTGAGLLGFAGSIESSEFIESVEFVELLEFIELIGFSVLGPRFRVL